MEHLWALEIARAAERHNDLFAQILGDTVGLIVVGGLFLIVTVGCYWLPLYLYGLFCRDLERVTGTKLSWYSKALAYRQVKTTNLLTQKQLQLTEQQLRQNNLFPGA